MTTDTASEANFRTVAEIRAANAKIGHHWFEKATLKFFNSKIGNTVYGGRYFITSERRELTMPERFTIREALPDGSIITVGEFQAYRTKEAARHEIRAILNEA
jgi:hypothetical protein